MFDVKKNRMRKAESKSSKLPHEAGQSFLSTKKALQKLSLSFYGEDTMKQNKQIILDNCDLLDSLPELAALHLNQQKKRFKDSLRHPCPSANKDINLKIDALFMDEKPDEFEFVTTNASQLDAKSKEIYVQGKKKVSRSNSVKVKDVHEKGKKEPLLLDVYSARCKTSKCVSRKSKLQDKIPKKK
jgi:hypothetical protein